MEKKEFKKMFWSQYMLYEKDFISTSDYVMIDKKNYSTFSNQYLKLLLAICSEIESVTSAIYNIESKQMNIVQKIGLITKESNIKYKVVTTKDPYDKIRFVPFQSFTEEKSGSWWKAYNLLKHIRYCDSENGRPNYCSANFENVITALSALFLLNCYLYYTINKNYEISLESKLFELE